MADEPAPGDEFVVHETDGKSTSVSEGSMEPPKAEEGSDGDAVSEGTSEGNSDGDDGATDGDSSDAGDGPKEDDGGDSDVGESGAGGDDGSGEAADEGESADESGEEGEPVKAKRSPKDRIAKITKNWREAQRDGVTKDARIAEKDVRIAELEKQLTGKGGDDTAGEDSSDGDAAALPKPDDFTYGEADPEYIKAMTEHLVEKGVAKVRATDETNRQEETARQQDVELQTQYDAKVELGVEAYDDFEEVVVEAANEGKYPLSRDMAMLAIESDVGHHVLHQIATDLPLAKKIARMTPLQQAREFGRIEAQHTSGSATTPKPNKVPKAPKPPSERKGGKGANTFNPVDASFEDFEKKVNADIAAEPRRY